MNSEIVFDPTFPEIDMNDFQKQDWSWSIYSYLGEELKEELRPDIPEPLDQPFVIQVYVDADHAR